MLVNTKAPTFLLQLNIETSAKICKCIKVLVNYVAKYWFLSGKNELNLKV
jgi:hypothetical protein